MSCHVSARLMLMPRKFHWVLVLLRHRHLVVDINPVRTAVCCRRSYQFCCWHEAIERLPNPVFGGKKLLILYSHRNLVEMQKTLTLCGHRYLIGTQAKQPHGFMCGCIAVAHFLAISIAQGTEAHIGVAIHHVGTAATGRLRTVEDLSEIQLIVTQIDPLIVMLHNCADIGYIYITTYHS